MELGVNLLAGVSYVLAQKILRDLLDTGQVDVVNISRFDFFYQVSDVLARVMSDMRLDDETSKVFVLNSVDSVANDTQNVET